MEKGYEGIWKGYETTDKAVSKGGGGARAVGREHQACAAAARHNFRADGGARRYESYDAEGD